MDADAIIPLNLFIEGGKRLLMNQLNILNENKIGKSEYIKALTQMIEETCSFRSDVL